MPQNSKHNKMKKILPLMLLALLAFAGCQSGPATFEVTDDPHQVVTNAEKFVDQVSKKSKNYTVEEWDAAIDQFILMGKYYYKSKAVLSEEEQMRYDNARMKFIGAVDATGNEQFAISVKEEYGKIIQ